MSLSFNDLDNDLQRSVFAAVSILCILLCLSLLKFVHYAFIIVTFVASMYMSYMLFIKPLVDKFKARVKNKGEMRK